MLLWRGAAVDASDKEEPMRCSRRWLRRVVTHHHGYATLREPIAAVRHVFHYWAGVDAQGRRVCGCKTPESFVASLESSMKGKEAEA